MLRKENFNMDCNLKQDLIGKRVTIKRKTSWGSFLSYEKLLSSKQTEALEQKEKGYTTIDGISFSRKDGKWYYAIRGGFYNESDFAVLSIPQKEYTQRSLKQ